MSATTAIHPSTSLPTVVYLAGKRMGANLDTAMAESLSQFAHVLWIDPPTTDGPAGCHSISPTLTRVTVPARSGPFRRFRRRNIDRAVANALAELNTTCSAVILSDPTGRFPMAVDGHRLYYVTDDWVSAAPALNLPRRAVRTSIEVNCARANTIAAVSHTLSLRLHLYSKTIEAVRVVPNGCTVPDQLFAEQTGAEQTGPETSAPVALLGPFDDTLDFDLLDAAADSGVDIVALGSKATSAPTTTERLESFLSRPNVSWIHTSGEPEISRYLARARVGIAPLVVDAVNRARFPVQPLEYLAAGLAVVTTDLPATRRLGTEHVTVTRTTEEFVAAVTESADTESTAALRTARHDAASSHSWTSRATTLLRLMALFQEPSTEVSSPASSTSRPQY